MRMRSPWAEVLSAERSSTNLLCSYSNFRFKFFSLSASKIL
jgi:hypothetical protein